MAQLRYLHALQMTMKFCNDHKYRIKRAGGLGLTFSKFKDNYAKILLLQRIIREMKNTDPDRQLNTDDF